NHRLADGVHVTDRNFADCSACREGKQVRSNKASHDISLSAPTDEIGAVLGVDIKCDVKPHDYGGNRHTLHVVGYASSYGGIFPMKKKSNWFQILMEYIARLERQHDVEVKVLRSSRRHR
ncbi:TPA: hypothetical protein N0F65_010126, partial [Lagenidium giganteum]